MPDHKDKLLAAEGRVQRALRAVDAAKTELAVARKALGEADREAMRAELMAQPAAPTDPQEPTP